MQWIGVISSFTFWLLKVFFLSSNTFRRFSFSRARSSCHTRCLAQARENNLFAPANGMTRLAKNIIWIDEFIGNYDTKFTTCFHTFNLYSKPCHKIVLGLAWVAWTCYIPTMGNQVCSTSRHQPQQLHRFQHLLGGLAGRLLTSERGQWSFSSKSGHLAHLK